MWFYAFLLFFKSATWVIKPLSIAAGITIAIFANIFCPNGAVLVLSVSDFPQCCLSLAPLVSLPPFVCQSLWLPLAPLSVIVQPQTSCSVLYFWLCGVAVHLVTVVLVSWACLFHLLACLPVYLPACLYVCLTVSLSLSHGHSLIVWSHRRPGKSEGKSLSVSRLPMDCLHPLPHLPPTCMSHSRAAALSNTL